MWNVKIVNDLRKDAGDVLATREVSFCSSVRGFVYANLGLTYN